MHPIILKQKNITRELKEKGVGEPVIRVAVKEMLQNHILNAIFHSNRLNQLVFIGGTALRKLYQLDRFSEDLDFNSTYDIDLKSAGKAIHEYFKTINFDKVDFNSQQGKLLRRITFKFSILKDLGLSPFDEEKLHVKVEINKCLYKYPTELSPLSIDGLSMVIKHYDLPTMMSGKILACLDRVWKKGTKIAVKGRDYYDLIWFMQKGIKPNERKLKETNKEYGEKTVFQMLDKKVRTISNKDLYTDLQTYHTDAKFIRDWCDNFHEFYTRYRRNY